MSLIVGKKLSRSYGATPVFENVSIRLGDQDRVGLVGPNGEGKTTLLRILAGVDRPTEGTLERKGGLAVGYLPQDPPAPRDVTVWDAMLDVLADLLAMERQLHELADDLAHSHDEQALTRYGALQHEFEARGGYDYPVRIETVLTGLGFAEDQYRQPLAQLSGGQRTRAHLAGLLLAQPELLLLDEPTNHLDLQAAEWLERYLHGFRGALVVVSHDRYFLDKVTTDTWEVSQRTVEQYRGNYTTFVKKRAERVKERTRLWESQQEYITRTEDFIRRNISGQRSREAKGRRTRLQRFLAEEAIPKPRALGEIHVRITPHRRSGDLVLRATDLSAGYEPGRALVGAESIEVRRGDRVAIVGPNGSGKTTLLRTLLDELPPLGGEIEFGANVETGYLRQTHDDLPPDATVLDALIGGREGITQGHARTVLGSFLFHGDDVFKKISELSGGQRSRVVLAKLSLSGANLLVLDEPTNHLDLPSREILQEALDGFGGTVVFVSHDRYLVQGLATHIWALDDGDVHRLEGDWESYVSWRASRATAAADAAAAVRAAKANRTAMTKVERLAERERQKDRQRLQRQHDKLEEQIHQIEAELASLTDAISRAGEDGDLDDVHRLGKQFERENEKLREMWDRWVQIGEEMEG